MHLTIVTTALSLAIYSFDLLHVASAAHQCSCSSCMSAFQLIPFINACAFVLWVAAGSLEIRCPCIIANSCANAVPSWYVSPQTGAEARANLDFTST